MSTERDSITLQMTISEILDRWPEIIPIFLICMILSFHILKEQALKTQPLSQSQKLALLILAFILFIIITLEYFEVFQIF